MSVEVLTNEKAVLRGVASAFVNKKAEIKKLLNKYGANLSAQATNQQLFDNMLNYMQTNAGFRNDMASLMVVTGQYQNVTTYNNIAPGIITGIGSILSGIISKIGSRKNELNEEILTYASEKEAQKRNAMLIAGTIILVSLIGTVIIVLKSKK